MEEFPDDRGHPGEMSGPGRALEDVARRSRVDGGARPIGIHVTYLRDVDTRSARGLTHREIRLDRARVGIEVFARSELQRIHEDGDQDFSGVPHALACGADQLRVAFVQGTHRHDDGSATPGFGDLHARGPDLHHSLRAARTVRRAAACSTVITPAPRARSAASRPIAR